MSAITPVKWAIIPHPNPDQDLPDSCCICSNEFNAEDPSFTHEGEAGAKHPGLHKDCWKKWIVVSATCPHDRQPIDTNSVLSLTEKIMAKVKPALANAAYAGCCGTALAVAAGAGIILGSMTRSIAGAEETILVRGTRDQAIVAATELGTVVALAAEGLITILGMGAMLEEEIPPLVASAGPIAGIALGALLGAQTQAGALAGAGAGALAGAIILGTGLSVGKQIHSFLNSRQVDETNYIIIQRGTSIGGLAGLSMIVYYRASPFAPLIIPPTIALTATIATAILSLTKTWISANSW